MVALSAQELTDIWYQTTPHELEKGTTPETCAPHVVYHASPMSNLRQLRSPFEMAGKVETIGGTLRPGVFFTEIPSYAVMYCRERAGARIYRAEVIARKPYLMEHAPSNNWETEARTLREVADQGYDCVLKPRWDGVIWELVAFPDATLKYRSAMGEVCLEAERAGAAFGKPIYCDKVAWPMMSMDVLRCFGFDCVVDPDDGETWKLDQSKYHPLNRAALRALRAKRRRRLR